VSDALSGLTTSRWDFCGAQLGEQGDLASIFSLDESLHHAARVVALRQSSGYRVFTQPRPIAVAERLH